MFDERTGVLAHWEFLSFRELDQHSAAAYFSGVLIRTLLFMSFDLLPLFCFRCFCLFLYCMGTRALFHIPFFFFFLTFGRIAFQVIVKLVFLLWSVRGAHTAFVFLSTICVSHLPHTPVLSVIVSFCLCSHCPIYARVIRYAPYEAVFAWLGSVRVWDSFLFSTVIPLYIHLLNICVFIIASSRVNRKWILLLSPCNSLSSYASTKEGLLLGFSILVL